MADTAVGSLPAFPSSAARSDAAGAVDRRDHEAERAKLKQLAQEFEAMLMNEMLSGWRRSLMDDDESQSGGMGNMTDLATSEFGRALSRSGGLGIAAVLERAFERQQGAREDAPPLAPTRPAKHHQHGEAAAALVGAPIGTTGKTETMKGNLVASRAEMGTPSIVSQTRDAMRSFSERAEPVNGAVTSRYGWRSDPFTGQSKFHSGVDIRMAYGQSVSSVASGRVSFSGTQGGYGLTVIVDHGDGMATRYAHLSSIDVKVGDQVEQGQAVARSGSSGTSTGPHLHVEVLNHGQPVDPAALLKRPARSADWEAYRSPAIRTGEPGSGPG